MNRDFFCRDSRQKSRDAYCCVVYLRIMCMDYSCTYVIVSYILLVHIPVHVSCTWYLVYMKTSHVCGVPKNEKMRGNHTVGTEQDGLRAIPNDIKVTIRDFFVVNRDFFCPDSRQKSHESRHEFF